MKTIPTAKPARTKRKAAPKPAPTKPALPGEGLVALLEKFAIKRPSDFDWKEDYIQALEEKYANIR